MSAIKKPMLAPNDKIMEVVEKGKLKLPMFYSDKLDGFRAFVQGGRLLTRSGAAIVNEYTQHMFGRPEYEGLDGELIVGAWNLPTTFHTTSGAMKRVHDEPDVRFCVFDDRERAAMSFADRYQYVERRVRHATGNSGSRLDFLRQYTCLSIDDVWRMEEKSLRDGFEGGMLKDPTGQYKFGRATVNEGLMFKVVRFAKEEARIIGFIEQMENLNEAYLDDLGRMKRSSAKDGLIGSGMVGSFIVESDSWPEPFGISASTLTHDQKKEAFANFETMYKGQLARFTYKPHGVKDKPRQAIFDGLRDPNDL